jgi:hypothetical protein
MAVANTLAYYDMATIKAKKSFTVHFSVLVIAINFYLSLIFLGKAKSQLSTRVEPLVVGS